MVTVFLAMDAADVAWTLASLALGEVQRREMLVLLCVEMVV